MAKGGGFWTVPRCEATRSIFDIPSLKTIAIEQITRSLTAPSWMKYYKLTGNDGEGNGSGAVNTALTDLMKLYPAEANSLDEVLRVLSKEGYLPQIIRDTKMREKLDAEPKILGRLLGIQLGIA